MSEQTGQTGTLSIIDKYDQKTIKIGDKVFRISIEYVQDMLLEVTLVRLSTNHSYRSTMDPDDTEYQAMDDFEKEAWRKSLAIARTIEKEIDTDFEGDDFS